MENEEKKKQVYECTNCDWSGTERSVSCATQGELTKDGVHLDNMRCSNCGILDDMCPVCGDNVGKIGVRAETRKKREDEFKQKFNGIELLNI